MISALLPARAAVSAEPPGVPPPLDLSRLVHPADWARLPEALRQRFGPRHGPARYAASLQLERSRAGLVFALLAAPFRSPLPRQGGVELVAVVDVRPRRDGVVWSRRLGPATVVRSVKSAGPGGTVLEHTEGGLGMVLDVSAEGSALVFTSRSFFLEVGVPGLGRWRVPVPAWLTPGRCRVSHEAVDAERFRFTLTMTHPLWGTTFRQSGLFTTVEMQP